MGCVIPPLQFARALTGLEIKSFHTGIAGRISTCKETLILTKTVINIENLTKGPIRVLLYNTSPNDEALINIIPDEQGGVTNITLIHQREIHQPTAISDEQ